MAEQIDYHKLKHRMDSTGIGYAGIDGVWWLMARTPFHLPTSVAIELNKISQAVFTFLDVVTALYRNGESEQLRRLLRYKVPEAMRSWMGEGRVYSLRPDFQLLPLPGGGYQPIITELEICPSAHGFAHAMQAGYGLPTDLADSFAHFLDGRIMLFAGTAQWSAFLFEQLAFCRALARRGAQGRVLYELPIATLRDQVRQGQRWRLPMFGIQARPAGWDDDLLARIEKHELDQYLWPDEAWPDDIGDAVVFRFGYCDSFAPEKLAYFDRWRAWGATLLNPAAFILDNKAIMTALNNASVRQHLHTDVLTVLDRCIPETRLLHPEDIDEVTATKDEWVVKYAGFDGDNQGWGGRSLQIGAAHSLDNWRQTLRQMTALSWPVVAQRVVPSGEADVVYLNGQGQEQVMRQGRTRLRAFFIRGEDAAVVCGAHVTVSPRTMRVAEGTNAVQAPVIMEASKESDLTT
jgi:hypothetical protein